LMALTLQEHGIGQREWLDWIKSVPAFAAMPAEKITHLMNWMINQGVLWNDQGILGFGRKGEEEYGQQHFLELFSVFLSPPLFSVRHGRRELGFVDELTFLGKHDDPQVVLLAGRAWRVTYIDWQRRVAYVESAEAKGRSRWTGAVPSLTFRLCQAIRRLL